MHLNDPNEILYGIPLSRWRADALYVKSRLDYASYISDIHKYVYVETPKVACTNLKMMIHRLEGLPPIKPSLEGAVQTKLYMYIHARYAFKMPSLGSISEHRAEEILANNNYFKFCFVRNPYSRLVSVWGNKVYPVEPKFEGMYQRAIELYPECFDGKFLRFDGFVRFLGDDRNRSYTNPHWALQSSLLFPKAINYDVIGKVEEFKKGISTIEEAVGISFGLSKDRSAPNASHTLDWRGHYNKELAEAVYNLYREDFELFGYDADSWKGGTALPDKTQREIFLENEIFERNRVISMISEAAHGKD